MHRSRSIWAGRDDARRRSASEITRQVYLHSLTEDRRSAVMKLEALLIGPKLDPSLGLEQLSLPEFVDAAGDNGRGDRI